MKAADLETARLLCAARESNLAMRRRLTEGQRLKLSIGEGGNASGIVIAPAYEARLRADLVAALDARLAENEAALKTLGVEP